MAGSNGWTSSQARSAAASIVRTLRAQGHRALFAGGCVRDELLGLEPTDYDVATDATPERVKKLFPRSGEVGRAFGVMLVQHEGVIVEVATFRADGDYTDKRRPDDVTFGDEVADAQRRDFTINALFLDPLDEGGEETPQRGELAPLRVIDHVGGVADLGRRRIRAVGDARARLGEDHLRALRAIRFACRLQFVIEDETRKAIQEEASALEGVSRERIGDEVRKMLGDASRRRAALVMEELGLDVPVLGEDMGRGCMGEGCNGSGCGGGCSGGALAALSWVPAGGAGGPSVMTALAAWLFDRGALERGLVDVPTVVREMRSRLMLSNDERDELRAVVECVLDIEADWERLGEAELGVAARKRLIAQRGFGGGLAIVAGRNKRLWERVRGEVVELAATPSGITPEPILTGDDLIGLGLRPGPEFARVLRRVYDEQLEGRVADRTQAERFIRSL